MLLCLKTGTVSGFRDVPKDQIPSGVKEGDILRYENNVYTLEKEASQNARDEIRELMKRLKK